MSDDKVRFSISIEWDLLKEFDAIIAKKGFVNRSQAIRELFRRFIVDNIEGDESLCDSQYVVIYVSSICAQSESEASFSFKIDKGKFLCFSIFGNKKDAESFVSSLKDVKIAKIVRVVVGD